MIGLPGRGGHPPHYGHRHGHGFVPAPDGRPATEIYEDGKGA
jgi:hypothetical protein